MHLLTTPYARLMRLHQPVGVWLLLWPCWWAIALASHGRPSLLLLALFGVGAVVMRSAGCAINDIVDRDLDKQVERTRSRPLASGELTVKQAFALIALLLIIAAGIAFTLGKMVLLWAALSLPLVITYPFMKRISWWPQLFLGFTFNWGALLGWVAVRGTVELPAILLYIGGIFWTLGYDTIYAHQDKADDTKAGIKSTALRLGDHTKKAVGLFYLLAVIFWAFASWAACTNMLLPAALVLAEMHFGKQICTVNLDDPSSCRRIFVSNVRAGAIIFMGILLSGL